MIPRAVEALGKLDILVNNAGITRDNLTMRMKDEEFSEVIQVNLEAAFRLMRAACKPMMRARFGRIISVTSVVGVTGNPGQANYVASKAGLIGMSKAVAQEVASRGITVNCVAPGFMTSAMTDALNDAQTDCHPRPHPVRRDGDGGRYRRGGGLSGVEGSRIRHWPDAACERRNGDAVRPRPGWRPAHRAARDHDADDSDCEPGQHVDEIMAAVDRRGGDRVKRGDRHRSISASARRWSRSPTGSPPKGRHDSSGR